MSAFPRRHPADRTLRPVLRPLAAVTLALPLALGAALAPVQAADPADPSVPDTSRSAIDSPAEARTSNARNALADWAGQAGLARGKAKGATFVDGRLRFDRSAGTVRTGGTTWERATWTSKWTSPGFSFTQLIPSWQARTPGRSAVRVRVRARTSDGRRSSWDSLALWAAKDKHLARRSYGRQADDLGRVDVDTWVASGSMTSFKVRVELLRPVGRKVRPSIDRVTATAGTPATVSNVSVSKPGVAKGIVLDVPSYSQMTHRGHYPQFGGGGEAWCSPTSVSMVLAYHRALPGTKALAWIPGTHTDRVVDHGARSTYDHAYRGAGNWSFSAAYAASRGRQAHVERMADLRAVEKKIKAGIPVIVSVRFAAGELSGAPIRATNGHLMVVVGFTRSGDVVVNDPAASSNAGVRRTYDRRQFENVWLPPSPSGSGGLTYVIS